MQSLHDPKRRYAMMRPISASSSFATSATSAFSAVAGRASEASEASEVGEVGEVGEVKMDAEFSFASEDAAEPGTLAFTTQDVTAVRVIRQHTGDSRAFILGPVFTVSRSQFPEFFNENVTEYPQAALDLLGELEPDGCAPAIPAVFRECITERWRQREQFPDQPPTENEMKTGYITDLFLNKFCGVRVSVASVSSAAASGQAVRYTNLSLRTSAIPKAERVELTDRELWLLRVMLDMDTSAVNRFVLNREQSDAKLATMGEGSWLLRASSIGDSADGMVTVRVLSFRSRFQTYHQLIAQVAGLGYITFTPGFPGRDNEAVADFRANGMPTQHQQKFIAISGMYPSFVNLLTSLSTRSGFTFDLAKFVM